MTTNRGYLWEQTHCRNGHLYRAGDVRPDPWTARACSQCQPAPTPPAEVLEIDVEECDDLGTHCPHGHRRATYQVWSKRGQVRCLMCVREENAAQRDEIRAAIAAGTFKIRNPDKVVCVNGHSLANDWGVTSTGYKRCRTCANAQSLARKKKKL